jgi:hypothetical protein
MLRRGHGYGIKGATWRQGRQKRPPARPRDVKAAARKLAKRLRNHANGDPELLRIAAVLGRCDRRHRCMHPACPQCGRAVQRTLVEVLSRFLDENKALGPWVMLSIILAPLDSGGDIGFAAESQRYLDLLRAAGLTLAMFGLDLSFNEDDRRTLPEADRFEPHPCVHLYGLALASEVTAALPTLKRLAPATEIVRRPIRRKRFDGNPAALAYAFKPDFARRLTIMKDDPRRPNPVRTTRDRPLTVEQQLWTVRALARAGLTGRMLPLGLDFEAAGPGQLRLVPGSPKEVSH